MRGNERGRKKDLNGVGGERERERGKREEREEASLKGTITRSLCTCPCNNEKH